MRNGMSSTEYRISTASRMSHISLPRVRGSMTCQGFTCAVMSRRSPATTPRRCTNTDGLPSFSALPLASDVLDSPRRRRPASFSCWAFQPIVALILTSTENLSAGPSGCNFLGPPRCAASWAAASKPRAPPSGFSTAANSCTVCGCIHSSGTLCTSLRSLLMKMNTSVSNVGCTSRARLCSAASRIASASSLAADRDRWSSLPNSFSTVSGGFLAAARTLPISNAENSPPPRSTGGSLVRLGRNDGAPNATPPLEAPAEAPTLAPLAPRRMLEPRALRRCDITALPGDDEPPLLRCRDSVLVLFLASAPVKSTSVRDSPRPPSNRFDIATSSSRPTLRIWLCLGGASESSVSSESSVTSPLPSPLPSPPPLIGVPGKADSRAAMSIVRADAPGASLLSPGPGESTDLIDSTSVLGVPGDAAPPKPASRDTSALDSSFVSSPSLPPGVSPSPPPDPKPPSTPALCEPCATATRSAVLPGPALPPLVVPPASPTATLKLPELTSPSAPASLLAPALPKRPRSVLEPALPRLLVENSALVEALRIMAASYRSSAALIDSLAYASTTFFSFAASSSTRRESGKWKMDISRSSLARENVSQWPTAVALYGRTLPDRSASSPK
mmetsp:Transcript_2043/g.6596  ORF Transcript_2043/g.6596 Transcript_2043/m.6596 type:complete len:617 (-) Transcript_2043:2053-3903(-)